MKLVTLLLLTTCVVFLVQGQSDRRTTEECAQSVDQFSSVSFLSQFSNCVNGMNLDFSSPQCCQQLNDVWGFGDGQYAGCFCDEEYVANAVGLVGNLGAQFGFTEDFFSQGLEACEVPLFGSAACQVEEQEVQENNEENTDQNSDEQTNEEPTMNEEYDLYEESMTNGEGETEDDGCTDIQPDGTFTCAQQAEFDKCEADWMLAGGFCARTCGRAPCPSLTQCQQPSEVLASIPELSVLVSALNAAGINVDSLDFEVTLFAPIDSAFEKRPQEWLGLSPEELLQNTGILTAILNLHIVPEAEVVSEDFATGKSFGTLLSGATVYVGVNRRGARRVSNGRRLDSFLVEDEPIKACGMTIYKIYNVLVPKAIQNQFARNAQQNNAEQPQNTEDIQDEEAPQQNSGTDQNGDANDAECKLPSSILSQTSNLSILQAALAAANIDLDLLVGNDTVFAPTDEAFLNLLDSLSVEVESLLQNAQLLTAVLQLHVVPGILAYSDDFAQEDVVQVPSLLQGDSGVLEIVKDGQDDILVRSAGTTIAKVLQADIEACNTVIHVVDTVLLPTLSVDDPSQLPDLFGIGDGFKSARRGAVLASQELDCYLANVQETNAALRAKDCFRGNGN
eukprot:TRINITY_DN6882_c0_g2_i12.p2 TRINITY_DN6882_c0_g2~~TRINITY_DN6882_c0_g2_i12.p2  ORF type:complete len:620 (-),score=100.23 TRINITY_DN6882_c0_g2_i12:281-2140(-)